MTATATVMVTPGNVSFTTTCFDSYGLYANLAATDNLSGVTAIKYGSAQILPGQPLPSPALSNSSTAAGAAVPFVTSGGYVLTCASADNAANQEAVQTRWIFMARSPGIASAATRQR